MLEKKIMYSSWNPVATPVAETENKRKEVQVQEFQEVYYTADGKARVRQNIQKVTIENMESEKTIEAAVAQLGELFTKSTNRMACTVCGKESYSGCSECYTDYCSIDCQNADWPQHKIRCAQLAKHRWSTQVKQEPADEFEVLERGPKPLITEVEPDIQYNPVPIEETYEDPRRVIETHLHNYVPRNGEVNHFHLDPRLNRRTVEIEDQSQLHQEQIHADPEPQIRDPRLKKKYLEEKEKEKRPNIRVRVFTNESQPDPELFDCGRTQNVRVGHPEFRENHERQPFFKQDLVPPPPPSFSSRDFRSSNGPSSPPRETFTSSSRRRESEPPPPPLFTRDFSSGPSSPPRESRTSRHKEPEPSSSRHRGSEPSTKNFVFKPPLRKSAPPRAPPGPTPDYISLKNYDVDMNSDCENETAVNRNHRRYRNRDRDQDRDRDRDRVRSRESDSDREHYRGKRPLLRSAYDRRQEKENTRSPRHVDFTDIEYAKSEKVYPPEKLKVVGLVKESDEKYWVVEHKKYSFWKDLQQQLVYCSDEPVLTPKLNLLGACYYEQSWYRAKVIMIRPKLKVQFIDFGNTCNYEGLIRKIPDYELEKTKPLAFMIKFSDEVPKYKISRDFSSKIFEIEVTERTHEKVSICRLASDVVTSADTTMDFEEPVLNIKREPGLESDEEMDVDLDSNVGSFIESVNFKNNSVVVMTEIYKINEVFIRPSDEKFLMKFEKLKQDVNDYAQQARSYAAPPNVGEFCCARLNKDKRYYRAVVLTTSEDLCSLSFVDNGLEHECQLKYIKPLAPELKRIPYCAKKVQLDKVISEIRPAEVINYYNKLIVNELELILSYRININRGVLLTENASGIVVNDYASNIIVKEIQKTELFFEKDLQFLTLERGDVKDLMVTYIEKDEYDKSGVFYMTDPKCEEYKRVNKEYPAIMVECLHNNRDGYVPQEGELILAKYQGDWYRAINVEKLSDELFRVYFVDYGNESVCRTSCIRRIRKDLADAPCLAIKCCITGNEKIPKNSLLHKDIFDYIESNVNNVLLSTKVTKVVDGPPRAILTYVSMPEVDKVLPKY